MKKQILKTVLFLVGILLLVGLDQWTKSWAVDTLMHQPDITVIPNVLEFHYLENTGMAWGLFKNAQVFFYIITTVILVFVIYGFIKTPITKRYFPIILSFGFITAGAIGNLIDRLHQQYVVDFIYVSAIHFPVFNVADIFVTLGSILLIILLMFFYQDDELKELYRFKKEKTNEHS